MLTLTNEEEDVLAKIIQVRRTSLNKQIYDLINLNVSLQTNYEDIQKQINQIENLNEQSIKVLDDIKERYQESLENQEKQKLKEDIQCNSIENKIESIDIGKIGEITKSGERQNGEFRGRHSETKTVDKKSREEDRYSFNKKVKVDLPNPESWNKFK